MSRAIVVLLAAAALALPACGKVAADSPSGASSGSDVFFATNKVEEDGGGNSALFTGPLVVKNGCVLVGEPGNYTLPVWRKGFTADRDASGHMAVRDADGAIIAVEGENFEMGGGYTAEFRPADKVEAADEQTARVEDWLGYQIPARCLTPDVYGIWVVGDTEPLRPAS